MAAYTIGSCKNVEEPKKMPNIVVIVADDLGYSDLSFLPYASSDVHTPNIDRLAERGVFFTDAYSTAPICSPARAGLITGRYQTRWGNYWYHDGGLPANEQTFPQLLKKKGYHTIKIGKTHLNGGPVEHPLDHGFDDFLGFINHTWDYLRLSQKDVDKYGEKNASQAQIGPLLDGRKKKSFENSFTTDVFTQKTIEEIRKERKQPFYIQLEYNAVHHPTYVCHPDYLKKYGIQQFPFWDPGKESWTSWHNKWGFLGEIDPDGRRRYLSQLNVLDDGIGKILDALEKTGKLDNTIIFFLSDNGGTLNTYARNYPLNGYKFMFGEGGIRVPMILSYPERIKQRKSVSQMVSTMDILPTVLDAINASVPENLDGKSLWPVIEKNNIIHEVLVWSFGYGSWAVRKGKWKLVQNSGWLHNTFRLEEGTAVINDSYYKYPGGSLLYNLEEDISETKNLINGHSEIAEQLKEIYNGWRSQMSDPRTGHGELREKPSPGTYIGNSLSKIGAVIESDGDQQPNHHCSLIIDGYDKTFWKHSGFPAAAFKSLPHYVTIDFNSPRPITIIKYSPVPYGEKGRVSSYRIYISDDGKNWRNPIKTGHLPDNDQMVKISLEKQILTRHLKFEITGVHSNSQDAAISEIDIE